MCFAQICKVTLALSDEKDYTQVERQMYDAIKEDQYFAEISLEPAHVQTVSHLNFTRGVGGLLGSGEQTDQAFNDHAEAIRFLNQLAQAIKVTSQELVASIRALKTAKTLEAKEQQKDEKRREAARKKAEESEKKKAEKKLQQQKLAEEKAKELADQNAKDASKKRRAATKLADELGDADPEVLKAKFPDHQLHVCDTVESFLHISSMSN